MIEGSIKATKYYLNTFKGIEEPLPDIKSDEIVVFLGSLAGMISGVGHIVKTKDPKLYNMLIQTIETLAFR